MSETFFNNDTVDFGGFILKSARETEANGDMRSASKTYAHAWSAGASANNLEISSISRLELFSVVLLINDLVFTSVLYRDLISTFSLDNRFHSACAHYDLGKLYRNSWENNEILNPSDATKHLLAAKDEFFDLNELRNTACVEMDLAHIYMHIDKIEHATELLSSARNKWEELSELNGMAESALSLGDCNTLIGKNEVAEKFYRQASNEFDQAGNNLMKLTDRNSN